MTVAGLDGRVVRFRGGDSVPRWVLPLRYSRRDRPFGIPFCPVCLREDAEPYFRLRWRLCLHSVCAKHRVRFVDACSRCGHPSWPATSALGHLYDGSWIPIHECPVCRFDLRLSPAAMDESEALPVAGLFFESDVTLSNGTAVPAIEFSAAAWCVAQLFVRNRSGARIYAAVPPLRSLAAEISASDERSIEWLPMATRAQLISRVAVLFQDWPKSLLAFSEQCGLSAEHFSSDRQELPAWFETAIRIPLRKQARNTTLADVEAAVSRVQASGGPVTKQGVARLLGVVGVKILDETLGRRTRASLADLRRMLSALDEISNAHQKRRSSNEVIVRDAVAILMAIAWERELGSIVEISCEEALSLISQCRHFSTESGVLSEIQVSLLRMSELYLRQRVELSRKRVPAADLFFVCFRGKHVQARSVQKLLRTCMRALDRRLARSVKVFWPSSLLID